MDTLIEYIKYTTALAVALLLYLPSEFLPTEWFVDHCIIGAAVVALGVAAFAGVLLYARATTMVRKNIQSENDRWLRIWGNIHFGLLIPAYLVGAYYFVTEKIIAPEPEKQCSVSFPTVGTTPPVTLTFACKAK